MKYKTNISALFLATLFFVASNGISIFEHICNTSNTRDFGFISKPTCENDEPQSPCCKELSLKEKDDCCTHSQIFNKLYVEGFAAKQLFLKPFEKQIDSDFFSTNFSQFTQLNFENYYSGLSPPDNLFKIKSILQPSSIKLQIFRC